MSSKGDVASLEASGLQRGDRFLTFALGADEFAVPLMKVREVIAVPEFTAVPHAPAHFLGMTNIRGQIITTIDLRLKLGIKPSKTAEPAVVIIDFGHLQLGALVDSVNQVLAPKPEYLSPRPAIETKINAAFIQAIYRREKHMVMILDIEKALGVEDWDVLKSARSAS